MSGKTWTGRGVAQARAVVAQWLPAPCGRCGKTVTTEDRWVVGHKKSRLAHPELMWMIDNWQPEHKKCSDSSWHEAVLEKESVDRERENSKKKIDGGFSPEGGAPQPPPLPVSLPAAQKGSLSVREDLGWTKTAQAPPKWLSGLAKVPKDGSPPLAMTPPHPDATGSYGPECIKWAKKELGITLRWWQRLSIVRQLEHDAEGRLLWRTVIESTPRRAGKSVRMRVIALFRLAHADLFGEPQTVIHTGSDVAICREIQRQAWRWAEEVAGWTVSRANGKEAIETKTSDRWLVRAQSAVYGYDCSLGLVDEAWNVASPVVDDGLEPATMERLSPQLVLTSTAHRRATNLMRKRITAALAADDGETLLMLWAAPPDADPADPETWRKASPHWSDDRRKMIAAKYEAALAGQTEAEADDPDPFSGFLAQYLNQWRLTGKRSEKGFSIVTEDEWDSLRVETPERAPDGIAVESWFSEGVSVALAWRGTDNTATVRVIDCADVAQAAEVVRTIGYRGRMLVGASLADDPAFAKFNTIPTRGRTLGAVQDFTRLLAEDAIRHDGTDPLRQQVLDVRTLPGVDGPRMVSRSRADAVKAAAWVSAHVRSKSNQKGKFRILLPTS